MSSATTSISADEYLRELLSRDTVDSGTKSPLRGFDREIRAICSGLGSVKLLDLYPTGAFEKGTANTSGVSIDFLASFAPTTSEPTRDLFERLFDACERRGLETVRRDVSVAVLLGDGVGVDVIPAKREALTTDMHELWLTRLGRPVKSNLTQHVLNTVGCGRREEIRVLKMWRDQQGLDFPSYYLELTVIAALRRRPQGELANNVWAVFGYLETLFPARSILDPVNANNIVSDQLGPPGKDNIRRAALYARQARAWTEIVW
jgi:hypothetical protein